MNILVLGCEGSGTRYVTHNIGLHPKVSKIQHYSVPDSKDTNPINLIIDGFNKNSYDAVVLVTRDRTCVKMSQTIHGGGWKGLVEKYDSDNKSINHQIFSRDFVKNANLTQKMVADICESLGKKYSVIGYESILQLRIPVLKASFRTLGLDPDEYEYYEKDDNNLDKLVGSWAGKGTLIPKDGNKKYFGKLYIENKDKI